MSQCYLSSPADDAPTEDAGPAATVAALVAGQALFRLIEALSARHHLGIAIRDGATSAQFPGGDAERSIRQADQEVDRRLDAYRRAQCSLLVGEPYRLAITGLSIAAEMRNALRRNDAAAAARAMPPADALTPALPPALALGAAV